MSITNKAAILKLFMVLPGVFCFADIHSAYEQAVRVYTEYRKVRSAEQILNLDSIREDLLITDKMKEFSYDGISTLIFHAYNPTIYICEDDYVVTDFTDKGSGLYNGKEAHDYFFKVEETIIGELSGDHIEKSNIAKKSDIIWMIEVDGRFYIHGDSTLKHIYIRESDFRELYGN